MNRVSDVSPAPDDTVSSGDALVRTFLIADVRGYTHFTVQHGDEAAAQLAAAFASLAREVIHARGGRVIELRGDEALAVFNSARQGLLAAVELQERIDREPASALSMKVGVGVDAGEAVPMEGGFRGAALNLAARLCSLAKPGEVLVSDTVANLARKVTGLRYLEHGLQTFKGFAEPIRVLEVCRSNADDATDAAAVDRAPTHRSAPLQTLPWGGYLGALPSGTLIGRGAELVRMQKVVDAVDAGTGRLMLLGGEPGAGKTRLAQEITREVQRRGYAVIAGRCYEPQQAVPFYPFIDALITAYAIAPPALRTQLPTRWPGIAPLLPTLGVTQGENVAPDQQRLLWSVTDFLTALAAHRPLAVLLDDLHWADAATIDLLQHLARHIGSDRILLLGTYRDDEINAHPSLSAALRDLQREGIVERLIVHRFTREDTGTFIAALVDGNKPSPALVDLVFHRTEGNPFFVQQVARMLVERGDIAWDDTQLSQGLIDTVDVPDTVRSVISQRLSRLSSQTQDILHEASVLGQTFAFEDLQGMSGREEGELETALEESIRVGIVREDALDEYGFDHALTQHVLYAQLSSRRRRRLHLAAGAAIELRAAERSDRRAAELARHFLRGEDPSRALTYSLRAGDLAESVFAHDDAAPHYHAARDLAQQLGDTGAEAAVHERLGGLYTATIQYDDALPALEQAARMYRLAGDGNDEARVVAQIGRVHVAGGSVQRGIALLQETLARTNHDRVPASQAALLSSLARLLYICGSYAEAQQAATTAVLLISDGQASGLQAEAEVTRGAARAMSGEWTLGMHELSEAVHTSEVVGDLFSQCRGLQHLASIRLARGESAESVSAMSRAMELADRMSNRRQSATTLFGLAFIAWVTGEGDVTTRAELAREMMSGLGGHWLRFLHSSGLSLALTWQEWSFMPDALRDLINHSEKLGDVAALRDERMLAERDLVLGQATTAITRLEALRVNPALEQEQMHGMTPLLAEAYLAGGDPARASALLDRALDHVVRQELRIVLPDLLRVRAMVRSHMHDGVGAAADFAEALAVATSIPYPASEARIRATQDAVQRG